jgi:hypothetical protein
MARAFRIIKRVFLIVGLLLLIAIPVIGLISTGINYEGICHNSTAGQWECTWWEYAGNEMFWAIFIFIPYLFIASFMFLGMSLTEFIVSLVRKCRQKKTPTV